MCAYCLWTLVYNYSMKWLAAVSFTGYGFGDMCYVSVCEYVCSMHHCQVVNVTLLHVYSSYVCLLMSTVSFSIVSNTSMCLYRTDDRSVCACFGHVGKGQVTCIIIYYELSGV